MTAQALPYSDRRGQHESTSRTSARGPRILPLMLFVLGVVALFFAMIYLRISLDQTAFELDRIQTEMSFEQSSRLDLRYDLAVLQDPLRIATEAQRIGLVLPDERVSVFVDLSVTDGQVLERDIPVRALPGKRP